DPTCTDGKGGDQSGAAPRTKLLHELPTRHAKPPARKIVSLGCLGNKELLRRRVGIRTPIGPAAPARRGRTRWLNVGLRPFGKRRHRADPYRGPGPKNRKGRACRPVPRTSPAGATVAGKAPSAFVPSRLV